MSVTPYTDAIPPSLVQLNPNVEQFATVLDNLDQYKDQSGILLFENMLNMWTMKDPTIVAAFLFELGQLPILTAMPVYLQERVILNSWDIFDQKGTLDGFSLLVLSFLDGTTTTNFNGWYPPAQLIPDDPIYGYLPDGTDLGLIASSPNDFQYLFGGSFSFYYPSIQIQINSDVAGASAPMRRDFITMVTDFLPMCYPGSSNVTVNFYMSDGVTFVESLNI